MKICLVCPYSFARPGGVKTHVLALYDQFTKKGHTVKIIAPRHSDKENYNEDTILLGKSIPIPGNSSVGDISISFDQGEKSIKNILEKEKFDIMHFHEPLVPFMSMQILNISNSVNIATFHAFIEKSKTFEYLEPVINNLKKIFLPKISKAIAVSELAKKYYEKDFHDKIQLIPNGINTDKFTPDTPPLITNKKTKILFLGRLEERKGIIYLLKAWKNIQKINPETQLIIAGEGPLDNKVNQIISKEKLSSVKKFGFIKGEDLAHLYNSAEIFCSPATHAESFGIVLLEAMACGIPIVAFANKGYSLILKDVAVYSLAKNKSVKDLSFKINQLISNDDLRKSLSQWGLKESKKYDWNLISDKIVGVYKDALDGR